MYLPLGTVEARGTLALYDVYSQHRQNVRRAFCYEELPIQQPAGKS